MIALLHEFEEVFDCSGLRFKYPNSSISRTSRPPTGSVTGAWSDPPALRTSRSNRSAPERTGTVTILQSFQQKTAGESCFPHPVGPPAPDSRVGYDSRVRRTCASACGSHGLTATGTSPATSVRADSPCESAIRARSPDGRALARATARRRTRVRGLRFLRRVSCSS